MFQDLSMGLMLRKTLIIFANECLIIFLKLSSISLVYLHTEILPCTSLEHSNPDYILHTESHPSWFYMLLSSHYSPESRIPSPHCACVGCYGSAQFKFVSRTSPVIH